MLKKDKPNNSLMKYLSSALFLAVLIEIMIQKDMASNTATMQKILLSVIIALNIIKWFVVKHLSQPLKPARKLSIITMARAKVDNVPLKAMTDELIQPINKARLAQTSLFSIIVIIMAYAAISATPILIMIGWSFIGIQNFFLICPGLLTISIANNVINTTYKIQNALKFVTEDGYLDAQAYINASATLADPRMFTVPLTRINDTSILGGDPDYDIDAQTLNREDAKYGDPIVLPVEALKGINTENSVSDTEEPVTESQSSETPEDPKHNPYVNTDGSPRYGIREHETQD